MLRTCTKCHAEKPLGEFHRFREDYQWWCKSCRKRYAAEHYQANKPRRMAQNRRRQTAFRAWYLSLKTDKPCSECGGVFHPVSMQWDHLPGFDKAMDVAAAANSGSRRRVLEEIAKCELVCANCHAVRSMARRAS